MLKKISLDQLMPGMYIGRIDGSWLDNPFWRSRFLVRSIEDVESLRSAAINGIWIDTERGLDVASSTEADGKGHSHETLHAGDAIDGDSMIRAVPAKIIPIECATDEASRICARAKDVVADIFVRVQAASDVDLQGAMYLVADMSMALDRNPSALLNVARLRSADEYTYMHSVAVAGLMIAFGRRLGFDEADVRRAGLAGLMHDVGKAKISAAILNKPAELNEAEWEEMRTHPALGYDMLRAHAIDGAVLDACHHHHEKFDGTGYPHGMKGVDIPVLTRMVSICDVYDAVTADRAYKKGWDPADALHRMATWDGHFDPMLFNAFVRTVGVYPIGAVVRLASQRLGVVTQRPNLTSVSSAKPSVRVVYCIRTSSYVQGITIDLASKECDDRIIAREDRALWAHLDGETFSPITSAASH